MQTGYVLCTLFATILNECHPIQPLDLWKQFKDCICDDLPWWLEHEYPNEWVMEDLIFDFGLFLLNQQLLKFEKTLADFPPMPLPTLRDWAVLRGNFLLCEQLDWDRDKLCADVTRNCASFNNEQRQLLKMLCSHMIRSWGKYSLSMLLEVVERLLCVTLLLLQSDQVNTMIITLLSV